jgi:hypothetical protein
MASPLPLVPKGNAIALERRVALYRRFLPDWPALIQSFQRDLDRARAAPNRKAKP